MTTTFIVDSSEILRLGHLERLLRKDDFLAGYGKEEQTMQAIRHMTGRKAHLLLPNVILQELTHMAAQSPKTKKWDRFREQGMGLSAKGNAYIDPVTLAEIAPKDDAKPFLTYLRAEDRAGKVSCFRSFEDYQAACDAGTLDGKIAVVPTPGQPLRPGHGLIFMNREEKAVRKGNQHGDNVIVSMLQKLPARPGHIYCVLSEDKGLAKRSSQESGHADGSVFTVNFKMFLKLLERTKFSDAAAMDKVTAQLEHQLKSAGKNHNPWAMMSVRQEASVERLIAMQGWAEKEPPQPFSAQPGNQKRTDMGPPKSETITPWKR